MQDVAAVRRAATEAVSDVDPPGLRERIGDQLAEASLVPGAFTLHVVRSLTDSAVEPGLATGDEAEGPLLDPLTERAAGVQLIYEGLALTRDLAQEDRWGQGDDRDEADLSILAADVLVARGFYLLARTEAADDAVATVQAFGHDQTVRRTAEDPSLDRNLEADVLELAVVAGTTAAGRRPTPRLREYAAGLAETAQFPPAGEFFAGGVTDPLRTLAADEPAREGVLPVDD